MPRRRSARGKRPHRTEVEHIRDAQEAARGLGEAAREAQESFRSAAEDARQAASEARNIVADLTELARRARIATETQEALVEDLRRRSAR
jgi:hypothetical protein